jgi:hypothetical protein
MDRTDLGQGRVQPSGLRLQRSVQRLAAVVSVVRGGALKAKHLLADATPVIHGLAVVHWAVIFRR